MVHRHLLPVAGALVGLMLCGGLIALGAGRDSVIHRTSHRLHLAVRRHYASVWTERAVDHSVPDSVAVEVTRLHAVIGRDFGIDPGVLRIELYGTHRSFSRALWQEQRQRPQTSLDNTSAIAHDTLLLGPLPVAYLHHNLAHVYTEWVMDRLTGNTSDALPSNTWLYDGLAEYEAYRYAPAGLRCVSGGAPPFDVTSIRTAHAWMALRPGPLGDMEYCLAYLRVKTLVDEVGWSCVIHVLHRQAIWTSRARVCLPAVAGSPCYVPTRTSTLIRLKPDG